jgi:hypothetical protein
MLNGRVCWRQFCISNDALFSAEPTHLPHPEEAPLGAISKDAPPLLPAAQCAERNAIARRKLLLRQPQPDAQSAGFRQRFEEGKVSFGERRVVGIGQGVGHKVRLGHGGQFVHGVRLAISLWSSGRLHGMWLSNQKSK